jgi:hypothetical protein
MSVFDIFSKRKHRQRGNAPDVYTYDQLPRAFRVQAVHIIRDLLGDPSVHGGEYGEPWSAYKFICDALSREYGVFRLHGTPYGNRDYPSELFNFLLETDDVEQCLDVIEISARYADRLTRKYEYLHEQSPDLRVDDGLKELNVRFREHAIGFQLEEGEIVRVDSDLIHAEAVKPALTLLRTKCSSCDS